MTRRLTPSTRLATSVLTAAVALVVTAGCRPGGPAPAASSPVASSPSVASPTSPAAAPSPTAAQRRAIRTWLDGVAGHRLAGLIDEQRAISTALSRHDVYAAFDRCQVEQVDVERAQEGRGVPFRQLDAVYQTGLARLAVATTHCLDAGGRGDRRDLSLARTAGGAAERRLAATLVAARRVAHR